MPSVSALTEFQMSRLETTLLPNLKGLTIWASTRPALLDISASFLHPRLEELLVETNPHYTSVPDVTSFLKHVTLRSPRLRELTIDIAIWITPNIRSLLTQVLSAQQSLEVLLVPPGMLTGSVLECLSRLSKLRQISFSQHSRAGIDLSPFKTLLCDWHGESDWFPSLLYLDVQTRLSSAASFISGHSTFAKLAHLNIHMLFQKDAESVFSFLHSVSEACMGLEVLTLTCRDDRDDRSDVLGTESSPITKDTLAPLVLLRELWDFSLTHTHPIHITDDELVDLLDACPKFTNLQLNARPLKVASDVSVLPSLSVIHRIANVQPELKLLSLYFNGLGVDPRPGITIMPFENLVSLDVGITHIKNADKTALYLSQVLPLRCAIYFNGAASTKAWTKVKEKVPLFTRVFSGYRKQARRLTKENDSLKEAVYAVPACCCSLAEARKTAASLRRGAERK